MEMNIFIAVGTVLALVGLVGGLMFDPFEEGNKFKSRLLFSSIFLGFGLCLFGTLIQ